MAILKEYPVNTPSTLAYFAGFFDGEGSICTRVREITWKSRDFKTKVYSFTLSATQIDPRPLRKLYDAYGGILVYRDRSKESNRRNIWLWQLCGQKAIRRCLSDMYPWLIVKKDRADIVFEALDIMQGSTGFRYTVQQRNVIIGAFDRLREKNKRGTSGS